MVLKTRRQRRRGAVVPLVAISLIAIMLFVSLAVDLGVIAIAHSQCQNAADAAAIAGARTLNGKDTDNNYANAGPNASKAAKANSILRVPITDANLVPAPIIGTYDYNYAAQVFSQGYPGFTANINWTLCKVTVQSNQRGLFFASLFNLMPGASGVGGFNTAAASVAVHRPRDVGIIIDMTGSMADAFILSYNNPSNCLATAGQTINDGNGTGFPNWQHYPSVIGGLTNAQAGDNRIADTASGTAIINDFWQHAALPELATSGGTPAFTAATPAGNAGAPLSGDTPLPGAGAATRLKDLTASVGAAARTALLGMAPYSNGTWRNYIQGPGYWGYTFFMWPPHPTAAKDWRQKFFSVPTTNLNVMWTNGTGVMRLPSGVFPANAAAAYSINYTAIVNWIQANNICPARVRCGRMQYHSGFPTAGINPNLCCNFTPVGGWDVWEKMKSNGATNEDLLNQRFWMEYIDWVLGVKQTSAGVYAWSNQGTGSLTPALLFNGDVNWGTVGMAAYDDSAAGNNGTGPGVNPTDNPQRPKLRFWFGALSQMDFCLRCSTRFTTNGVFGSRPGNIHEPQLWVCKRGVMAALDAMQNNHPNDYVACAWFSQPFASGTNGARMNAIRAPLGGRNNNAYLNSYRLGQMALWCPPLTMIHNGTYCDPFGTGVGDISAYDVANALEGPAADWSTAYAYPLMLIHNQFSTNLSQLRNYAAGQGWATAPAAQNGGYGRRGAAKIVILETDGAPNTLETANFVPGGGTPCTSYYQIRQNAPAPVPASFELPASTGNIGNNNASVTNQIFSLISQLTANEASDGFSTNSRPVLVYAVGFDSGGGFQPGDITTLNTIAQMGRTGAAILVPNSLPLTGPPGTTTKVSAVRDAFTKMLQDSVNLVLIQ